MLTMWTTALNGGDMSKPPLVLRRLDQVGRELAAAVAASAPLTTGWSERIISELGTTLATAHPLEAVWFLPRPPDNPGGAAVAALFHAQLAGGVATDLLRALSHSPLQLLSGRVL
jgi:hypothetical protein